MVVNVPYAEYLLKWTLADRHLFDHWRRHGPHPCLHSYQNWCGVSRFVWQGGRPILLAISINCCLSLGICVYMHMIHMQSYAAVQTSIEAHMACCFSGQSHHGTRFLAVTAEVSSNSCRDGRWRAASSVSRCGGRRAPMVNDWCDDG